jgi:hypothetical protein
MTVLDARSFEHLEEARRRTASASFGAWSTGIDHDGGTPDLSAVWLDRAVLWRYQRPPDNFMRGWRNW